MSAVGSTYVSYLHTSTSNSDRGEGQIVYVQKLGADVPGDELAKAAMIGRSCERARRWCCGR